MSLLKNIKMREKRGGSNILNFVECFIYYHLFLKHYLKEQLHPKGFFIVPSKMILFKDVRKSSIRALDWYFIDTFTYTLSKH